MVLRVTQDKCLRDDDPKVHELRHDTRRGRDLQDIEEGFFALCDGFVRHVFVVLII